MRETPEATGTTSLDAALMPASLRAVLDDTTAWVDGDQDLIEPSEILETDGRPWEVADRYEADYCARRAAHFLAEEHARAAEAQRLIDAATEWRDNEIAKIARRRAFYESRLEAFHRHELERDKKAKTITLPTGAVLESTAGKVSVIVDDPEAAYAWCEANEKPDALTYHDPTINKTAIVKLFGAKRPGPEDENAEAPAFDPETGDIVPGVRFVRGPRTFRRKYPTVAERAGEKPPEADDEG